MSEEEKKKKQGFFTIPLHEQDRERFAFTASTYKNVQPVKRYHWKDLPLGMLNSPTLCQYSGLEIMCRQCSQSMIYHYMDVF